MRPAVLLWLVKALSAGVVVRMILGIGAHHPSVSSQPISGGAGWLASLLGTARIGEESLCQFIPLPRQSSRCQRSR